MILTGQAKTDFLKHISLTEDMFLSAYSHREIVDWQLEWLDSVGIYISITPVFPIDIYGWSYSIDLNTRGPLFHPTCRKATEQAILKANTIYNETR